MDENEAREFLTAWQNYLRHLAIEATQQTIDLVTAVGVTVFCYTPRIIALQRRGKEKGHQAPGPRAAAQVFAFRPPQPSPAAWQPASTQAPPVIYADGPVELEADLSGNALGPAGNDPEAAE